MKKLATIGASLWLAGCFSVSPFGDAAGGFLVAKVEVDGLQDPVLLADRYCDKRGAVAYIQNSTPTRAVFTCRTAP